MSSVPKLSESIVAKLKKAGAKPEQYTQHHEYLGVNLANPLAPQRPENDKNERGRPPLHAPKRRYIAIKTAFKSPAANKDNEKSGSSTARNHRSPR
jgi:hypothetical protein